MITSKSLIPGLLYALLNVKMSVDVALFPGIVTVVEGVMVRSPVVLLPVQNKFPRLAYCKFKVLALVPPVE